MSSESGHHLLGAAVYRCCICGASMYRRAGQRCCLYKCGARTCSPQCLREHHAEVHFKENE